MGALVAHTAAGLAGGGSITTSAIDTTGSTLLVVAIADWSLGDPTTLSDSKVNIWTQKTLYSLSGDHRIQLYYAAHPIIGGSHTFTATAGTPTNAAPSLAVGAFSGIDPSTPFEAESGNTNLSTTSIFPGSITPSLSYELIVSAVSIEDVVGGTLAVNSGFTITDAIDFSSGNHFGVAMAYLFQGTAAAINPTWSWTGSFPAVVTQDVFETVAPGDEGYAWYVGYRR